MPPKKTTKRRFYRRRKKPTTKLTKPISYGFPRVQMVRMTYFEQIRIDPAGSPAHYVFRANSVFDPNYTGIGHQPMYHDQYAEVYLHYKVVSSKIDITGTNDYSDQNNSMGNLITCIVNQEPATYSSITEACESKGAKYRQCQERRPMKLSATFSAKKFFSIENVKDNYSIQGGLGNALPTGYNPTKIAYFVIGAHPLYAGQNSYPACLNIRISYNVLVYDIKKMSGS